MPDYAEMYKTLFRSQTEAIRILQEAQQATEEMYIASGSSNIKGLDAKKPEDILTKLRTVQRIIRP